MKEADVVTAPMLMADGQWKRRPVIVLRTMPRFGDFLVCGLSTQLHQQVPDFDELIVPDDDDFAASGLNSTSLIRLEYLFLLQTQRLQGIIGAISSERHRRLLKTLSDYLVK